MKYFTCPTPVNPELQAQPRTVRPVHWGHPLAFVLILTAGVTASFIEDVQRAGLPGAIGVVLLAAAIAAVQLLWPRLLMAIRPNRRH